MQAQGRHKGDAKGHADCPNRWRHGTPPARLSRFNPNFKKEAILGTALPHPHDRLGFGQVDGGERRFARLQQMGAFDMTLRPAVRLENRQCTPRSGRPDRPLPLCFGCRLLRRMFCPVWGRWDAPRDSSRREIAVWSCHMIASISPSTFWLTAKSSSARSSAWRP